MRKPLHLFAPICLAILFLFAGTCRGSEYLPLQEGFSNVMRMSHIQGNSRNTADLVLTNGPKTDLEGNSVSTMIMAYKSNGKIISKYFFHEDENGIRVLARQKLEDKSPIFNREEEWEIKYPVAVGTSWTERENVFFLKGNPRTTMTHTVESVDDTITVPAGTFKNCLRIKKYYKGNVNLGSYEGSPEIEAEGTRWYAPGVGSVKVTYKVSSSRSDSEGGEYHGELISFSN